MSQLAGSDIEQRECPGVSFGPKQANAPAANFLDRDTEQLERSMVLLDPLAA
ncbi:MAG: hypothetical protein M3025_01225 [Actinomycetota bacterium]|nr:hypothetical protein [Actinomycetota bacterium]